MKNLLVIADVKGGKNGALKKAVALQQQFGGKITLLGFCYADIHHLDGLLKNSELTHLSRTQLHKKIIANRQQELKQLVKLQKIKPSSITIKVEWSKTVFLAINAYCKKHSVDTVIKTAHRSGSFFYSSTDWQLIRECPAPVMITTGNRWKKTGNIIAALDFATTTQSKVKLNYRIFQYALALAANDVSRVHVVFALTIPQVLVDMDIISAKQYAREKQQKLQAVIDAFSEKNGVEKKNIHAKIGAAEKVIPSIASKLSADIVVAGTVGRKGIKGKLLGNTAEGILKRIHTDIVTIKP